MSRLIDANEFTEKCKEIIREENDNRVKITWAFAYDNFIDEINEQPTVDAVPVVRCKDCKYWQDNNGGYPHEDCKWNHDETPDGDDYCSGGERKDEAE